MDRTRHTARAPDTSVLLISQILENPVSQRCQRRTVTSPGHPSRVPTDIQELTLTASTLSCGAFPPCHRLGGPLHLASTSYIQRSLLHKHKGPQRQTRPSDQGRLFHAAAPFAIRVLGAEDRNCLWTRDHRARPGRHSTPNTGWRDPAAR